MHLYQCCSSSSSSPTGQFPTTIIIIIFVHMWNWRLKPFCYHSIYCNQFFLFSVFFCIRFFCWEKTHFYNWLKTIFPSFCQTKICKKLAPKKFTDYNTSQVVRGLQLPSPKIYQTVLQLCKQIAPMILLPFILWMKISSSASSSLKASQFSLLGMVVSGN